MKVKYVTKIWAGRPPYFKLVMSKIETWKAGEIRLPFADAVRKHVKMLENVEDGLRNPSNNKLLSKHPVETESLTQIQELTRWLGEIYWICEFTLLYE